MELNIFEEIQQKRSSVKDLANLALEWKWINKRRYAEILEKIENDTLTIGVIGQMKCGKSTFINAFLFKDLILPAATTPMTASLSIITYGEKKSIKAEFYSNKEWEEIELMASRDLSSTDDESIRLKIKSAKELKSKSSAITSKLSSLLGNTKLDSFESLKNYVSADGIYAPITKSVTIYYPETWLKGIELVDTPGFNDPMVSREERTKKFLKKADVVVMLLYAGRAFDAVDKNIIFEQVRNVGIGKVLIGINKYDINYLQGDKIEDIKNNVSHEIEKVCRTEEYRDSPIREVLKGLEPIPFSAHMALMSHLPLAQIRADKDLSEHWYKICDNFEISSQAEMNRDSLISDLESAIKATVEKSKSEILIKKSIDIIFQAGLKKEANIESQISEKNALLNSFSLSPDDLEKRIKGLHKVQKRMQLQTKKELYDLGVIYDEYIKKVKKDISKTISKYREELRIIVNNNPIKEIEHKLGDKINALANDILNIINYYQEKTKNKLISSIEEFSTDVEELIDKYVSEPEYLIDSFKLSVKIKLKEIKTNDIDDHDIDDEDNEKYPLWIDAICIISDFLKDILFLPIPGFLLSKVFEKSEKNKCHEEITNICDDLEDEYLPQQIKKLEEVKPKYLNAFESTTNKDIIGSLTSEMETFKEKETTLNKIKEEIKSLLKEKNITSNQIAEMKLKKNIV